MSLTEEKVLSVLSPTSIMGNKLIEESKVAFSFDDVSPEIPEMPENLDENITRDYDFLNITENSENHSEEVEVENSSINLINQSKSLPIIIVNENKPTPKKNMNSKPKRTVASNRLHNSAQATATLADLSRERFEFEKDMAIKNFELKKTIYGEEIRYFGKASQNHRKFGGSYEK